MANILVEVKDDDITLKYKNLQVEAYVGRNGITEDKIEGDSKTPIGDFALGICFGTHETVDTKLPYIQINEDLYWVDDVNSKYYNELVNIKEVEKDWESAEHLIDYPRQYEYAVEIKTNPNNIKGKGSAIFLHVKGLKDYTSGCVSIKKEDMEILLSMIDTNTKITIKQKE